MIDRILGVSLVATAFFCWGGWLDGIRAPKEAIAVLSMLAVIGYAVWKGSSLGRSVSLMAFGGWMAFLTVMPNLVIPISAGPNACIMLPGQLAAAKPCLYILIAILTILLLAKMDINFRKLASVISWTAAVMSIYALLQVAGIDDFFRCYEPSTGWVSAPTWTFDPGSVADMSRRTVGTIGNPTLLGTFLAVSLPFSLYLRKRWMAALTLVVVLCTKSATAWISAAIAVSLFYSFRWPRQVAIILAAGIILACPLAIWKVNAVKTFFNPTGRVEVIKESFKMLMVKPLTGLGVGSFEYRIGSDKDIVERLHNQRWRQMHNEYLQTWFEGGFIGLALALWFIGSMLRQALLHRSPEVEALLCCLVVIAVSAVTLFPLRVAPTSYYSVVLTGVMLNKIGGEA